MEHNGFELGLLSVKFVNQQDTGILPEALATLVDVTTRFGIAVLGAACTLDAAFASQDTKDLMKACYMEPVISPNRRHTKTPIVIARMFRWFDRSLYRWRNKVERTFGWEDTYRKLALSYDRLPETRKGGRLLASSR